MMETMGKKRPRRRRSFTPEFKTEIVDACRRGDRSIGQVARDFGLTGTAQPPVLPPGARAAAPGGRRDPQAGDEVPRPAPRRRGRPLWPEAGSPPDGGEQVLQPP